jgi:hypothetical protein
VALGLASSIINVKICRGLNCHSDHFLVTAVLRERLSNLYKHEVERIKWDLDKLKEPDYVKQYQIALERVLQINLNKDKKEDETVDIDADVETEWKRIKQSMIQTTTQIIIKKKKGINV